MAPPESGKKIRVLLAEDHTLVRQGFRRILEDDPTVTVVGEARTGLEAIEQCKSLKPEVVVMDLSMPELGGLEATAEILKANPQVKILILSMYSNEAYIRKAFELGAKGYMLKNAIEVDLNRAVKALAEGEAYFSPAISHIVLESLKAGSFRDNTQDPYERLTLAGKGSAATHRPGKIQQGNCRAAQHQREYRGGAPCPGDGHARLPPHRRTRAVRGEEGAGTDGVTSPPKVLPRPGRDW